MRSQAEAIRSYIINNIEKHPSDIVALTSLHFQVTRTTVHRHINALLQQKLIIKSGTTRSIKYYLPSSCHRKLTYKIIPSLQEYDVFDNDFDDLFKRFSKNIYDICIYGFTEIFNNAIDHSNGTKIIVETDCEKNQLHICITDNGIGIFKHISDYFRLDDIRESILQLNKGKMTTDPTNHTGEGIFFCARVFDVFEIYANNFRYIRDNKENDWSLEQMNTKSFGTRVIMTLNIESKTKLNKLFLKYQSPETMAFTRTDIVVELSKFGQEVLISRSQAKRIIRGLDKFTHVILDFKGVRLVGQGFVDEMFRVFVSKHKNIEISYINANEDIAFMIERGLSGLNSVKKRKK